MDLNISFWHWAVHFIPKGLHSLLDSLGPSWVQGTQWQRQQSNLKHCCASSIHPSIQNWCDLMKSACALSTWILASSNWAVLCFCQRNGVSNFFFWASTRTDNVTWNCPRFLHHHLFPQSWANFPQAAMSRNDDYSSNFPHKIGNYGHRNIMLLGDDLVPFMLTMPHMV